MRKNIKQIGKSYIIAVLLILTVCSVPPSVLSDEEEITFDTQDSVFVIEPSMGEDEIAGQTLEQWSAYIEHIQGDSFDWWINTTPDVGSASGINMNNGSISTSLDGIEYNDTFTVNLTVQSTVEERNASYNITIINMSKTEFLSDGNWTAPGNISYIDLLIVAGGGGGGGTDGSGGGAGGMIYKENYAVTPENTYDIVIGAGGAGGPSTGMGADGTGGDGENSSFGTLAAWGGGGGGYSLGDYNYGNPGGSGGGSIMLSDGVEGYYAHDEDPDTYGHDGGYGERRTNVRGGGAGSAGNDGGAGLTFWGTTYATGGRGGSNTAGDANTGDGGGGRYTSGGGKPGGSGIVIVVYPLSKSYSTFPQNGARHLDIQPTCEMEVYHQTDEFMINFSHNISGTWETQKTITQAGNGTHTWDFTDANETNTTYWWKVSIDDGTNVTSSIYSFRTKSFDVTDPLIPTNAHIEMEQKKWEIQIEEFDDNPFNWWINTTPDIGSANGTADTSGKKTVILSGLTEGAEYTINVTAIHEFDEAYGEYILKTTAPKIHEYTAETTWTVPPGLEQLDVAIIGGGGGGGSGSNNFGGGGGGAGGVIVLSDFAASNNSYDIDVGDGGTRNNNGDSSYFDSIEAIGGGAGAAQYDPGSSGGSGGGGHGYNWDDGIGEGIYNSDGDANTYGHDGGTRIGDVTGGACTGGSGGGGAGSSGESVSDGASGGSGGSGINLWGTTYAAGGSGGHKFGGHGYGGDGLLQNSGSTGGSGGVLLRYPTMQQGTVWPTHDTTDHDPQPTCTCAAYNEDGPMTITFAENSTGQWITRKVITGAENGTHAWKYAQATALNTTHWWRVSVDNGTANLTKIYNFTTGIIGINNFSIPQNGHIHRDEAQWWNITIADEAGQFNWSIETSPDIGSAYGTNEGNGTKSCRLLTPKEYLHFDEDVGASVSTGDDNYQTKEAILLNHEDLSGNDGNYLTSVRIYARSRSDCDLEIWEGGSKPDEYCCVYGGSAGTQLLQQELDLSEGTKWYDIVLDSPIKIDASSSYWIVVDNHDDSTRHTVYRDSGCVSSAFDRSNWLARPYYMATRRVCWLDANEWWGDRTQAWNIRAGISESAIEYSTTYTVYVNVTGSERNETYTFTTQSGPEDKIHVVLSPQATADIKLNRTTWQPNLGWAGNITTGLNAFNLDNNGSVAVDVDVYVGNGTAWHPGPTPGDDQFNLSINIGNGWNLMYNDPERLITNFAYDANQDFGLQLYKPTSTSTADDQNITLVFEATAR